MTIQAQEFVLRLTHDELWDLCFDVERALKDAVKTHWINHQTSWLTNESKRLHRHKSISTSLGRPDLHDILIEECKKILNEFNKSKK